MSVNVSSTLGEVTIGEDTSGLIKLVASAGISKAGTKLPHLDKIQSAFGRHNITNVQAHLAPGANDTLGTKAYTMGNHVAFAQSPSLRMAAHEATHVVQQRAGVQLQGGVGQAGDKYEQQADQVANEVVAGRSAEGILDKIVDEGNCPLGAQKQAVQFWGKQHKDFTRRAIQRWNKIHTKGTYCHILPHLAKWMIDCSDDPDHTGRLLTGTVSDLRIYYDFVVSGKKARHKEYEKASPAAKRELREAARKSVCASEGESHGEGKRPNYGSKGGPAANHAWMMSQIKWADRLTFGGGFMSRAAAGQLGDAMHCAQDRGSHCEGLRHQGHDDLKDKLGIGDHRSHAKDKDKYVSRYDTDCPKCNWKGARVADKLSDLVLIEFAKLRMA